MLEYVTLILLVLSIAMSIALIVLLRKTARYYKAVKSMLEAKTTTSKKPRKRYIVFTTLCEGSVSQVEVEKSIKEKITEYYGQGTLHKASPHVVLFDEKVGRGVVRVLHTYVDYVVAAMGLVKNIEGRKCIVIPIRTTGTLKKAREYIDRAKV
ncbi:MAG: Rpp14/Pop5 family protein [Desulfurococcaceae archaeon]